MHGIIDHGIGLGEGEVASRRCMLPTVTNGRPRNLDPYMQY